MADVRLGIEVVDRARHWVRARSALRRVLDSKSAKPEAVEKAKAHYVKASDELEKVVARVEKLAKAGALRKTAKKPIDWAKFADALAGGAKAVDHAVNTVRAVTGKPSSIIDAEFEVIEHK